VRFEVLQVVAMQITVIWDCGTVHLVGEVTTFRRNLLLPAAGHNSKPERCTDTDKVGMELGAANKLMGVMALWP
jgi:hypothetical protein